jgi:hypothetical protein
VQGYLGAVAGDAEVGVLDVDGDVLPQEGGIDAVGAGTGHCPSCGRAVRLRLDGKATSHRTWMAEDGIPEILAPRGVRVPG